MLQNTPNSTPLTRKYLLDTNIVSLYMRRKSVDLEFVHAWVENHEAATSIIVYGEMYQYIMRKPDGSKRLVAFDEFLEKVPPYLPVNSSMRWYAQIREAMPRLSKEEIGQADILIAATALDRGLTVVTTDKHFINIPYVSFRVYSQPDLQLIAFR